MRGDEAFDINTMQDLYAPDGKLGPLILHRVDGAVPPASDDRGWQIRDDLKLALGPELCWIVLQLSAGLWQIAVGPRLDPTYVDGYRRRFPRRLLPVARVSDGTWIHVQLVRDERTYHKSYHEHRWDERAGKLVDDPPDRVVNGRRRVMLTEDLSADAGAEVNRWLTRLAPFQLGVGSQAPEPSPGGAPLRGGYFPTRQVLLDAVGPAVAKLLDSRRRASRPNVAESLGIGEVTLKRAHVDHGFPHWKDVLAEVIRK